MSEKQQEIQTISRQQKWNEKNPDVVKQSQKKYDQKRPTWSFRPPPEILEWLEEERWDDENGSPETNAALVIRKLEKLRKLENQGY
jgi:O-methyltransferase involved in polyketide biosynthesis